MAKGFAKSFYNSRAWIDTRDAYIAERTRRDGGMCENCHENVGEELHHVEPLTPANISDYDICLNPDNLKWLCKDCHFRAHRELILKQFDEARERRRKSKILTNGCYMDEDGFLVKARRIIVWGAPASGKTSYVRANMSVGDLVVDVDALRRALTFQERGSDNLLPVVLSVRDCLYQLIEDKVPDCRAVWIIGCFPKRQEREELAKRLDAELIYMDADYHECIRRAGEDSSRENKTLQRALIDRYFEQLEK